jgi:hypothetical protein
MHRFEHFRSWAGGVWIWRRRVLVIFIYGMAHWRDQRINYVFFEFYILTPVSRGAAQFLEMFDSSWVSRLQHLETVVQMEIRHFLNLRFKTFHF